MRLWGVVAGVGLLVAACSPAKEQVVTRLSSMDGRYEAVLMVCQQPSDRTQQELLVAVFKDKGRGCDKPFVDAVRAVTLSHPKDYAEAAASIRWEGEALVVDSDRPRQFLAGFATPQGGPDIQLGRNISVDVVR